MAHKNKKLSYRRHSTRYGHSNVLGTLTPKHVHLLPSVFFQFYLEERCGVWMCNLGVKSQERWNVEDSGKVTIEC